MFTKAKWIWLENENIDSYADFVQPFSYKSGRVTLRLSCDSNYVAYINGKLAAFGQYADYPTHKIGDSVDVTEFVREGDNCLAIIVWYYGDAPGYNFHTYAPGRAGLIFEVDADGEILAVSDENTLSRLDPGYKQGRGVAITTQMGLDFYRDQVCADDRFLDGCTDGFAKSRIVTDAPAEIYPRPNKKLILGERQRAELIRTSVFSYPDDADKHPTAYNMNYASLAMRSLTQVTDKNRGYCFSENNPLHVNADSNIVVMIDLGRESVGFLDLDIEVPHDCRIDIGWGEHLFDGICRTAIRSFAVSMDAKAGRNTYMNPFRRFGCRYIQLFIHAKQATVYYAGLRPTDYPLNIKQYKSGNLLRDTIYNTCVDTLRLCMHEHYEDCPWREQALYALDSRNQMLCGYYAFGEYEFARASLRLLGESVSEEGLVNICAPMKIGRNIPSFSLAYFMQMDEYIQYSGDTTLAAEMYDTLERVINAFVNRIDETGLALSFDKDGLNWNFYEWAPTLSGSISKSHSCYEATLNLMLVLALGNFASICRALGKNDRAAEAESLRAPLCKAVNARFWDPEAKLYHTSDDYMESFSVLVNSLALLTGAADDFDVSEILRILSTNGKDATDKALPGIIPNTLSMNCFRYDALLRYDRETYGEVILNEIDQVYFNMLRDNATSFWETEEGEVAFSGAASLCHGWSALPVYYYEILS